LTASEKYFSPNNDGKKDSISFLPVVGQLSDVVSWSIDVVSTELSSDTQVANGKGAPSKSINFDGFSPDKNILSDGNYKAVLSVLFKNGNISEAEIVTFIIDTKTPLINSLSADFLLFSPDGDGNKDNINIQQETML
jgi:hypothetical protein